MKKKKKRTKSGHNCFFLSLSFSHKYGYGIQRFEKRFHMHIYLVVSGNGKFVLPFNLTVTCNGAANWKVTKVQNRISWFFFLWLLLLKNLHNRLNAYSNVEQIHSLTFFCTATEWKIWYPNSYIENRCPNLFVWLMEWAEAQSLWVSCLFSFIFIL